VLKKKVKTPVSLFCLQEVLKRFPDGPQLLNPIQDMGIREKSFAEIVKKIEFFEKSLFEHPLTDSAELEQLYNQYSEKVVVSYCHFFLR
jgi:hypothetical protein